MSDRIIKAFNQGYNMAKLDFEKAKKMTELIQTDSSEAMKYFKAGTKQFEKEQQRENLIKAKSHSQGRNKGIEYDE